MTPAPPKDPKPKIVECPACNGRKMVAFGPSDVPCGTCNGTGRVRA